MKKPEDYLQRPGSKNPGVISFTLSCCEIEGRKTVHFEPHGKFPFGHVEKSGIESLRTWLAEASQWLEE